MQPDAFYKDMKIESILNQGDNLPFAYYCPASNAKVKWMCGEDAEGNITSVFYFEEEGVVDKKCEYVTKDRAIETRDVLLREGWKPIEAPKMTFTYPGEDEERPLNRKAKRYLQKKIRQFNKQNPFKDDEAKS